jgi:hypothetical protein
MNDMMNWKPQFSEGVTLKPKGDGFYFDFPLDGHINYITAPWTGEIKLGMKVRVKWRLKRISGSPRFISLDGNPGLAPNFRPMICDDPLQNRWWSNPDCVALPANLDLRGELVVPIRAKRWSGVMGEWANTVKERFLRDLKTINYVALTFSGGRSFGHGIRVEGGVARLEILEYTIS